LVELGKKQFIEERAEGEGIGGGEAMEKWMIGEAAGVGGNHGNSAGQGKKGKAGLVLDPSGKNEEGRGGKIGGSGDGTAKIKERSVGIFLGAPEVFYLDVREIGECVDEFKDAFAGEGRGRKKQLRLHRRVKFDGARPSPVHEPRLVSKVFCESTMRGDESASGGESLAFCIAEGGIGAEVAEGG